ncbi:MAG TPA: metallophosphoesterase [Acidimicrobiia bacterium]|nr:metallophosphoesterase [Acidimicrobiia bacterium]
MILAISDVHFALDALRRVVAMGQPVLILGDLVNLTDYRTGEGAVADVLGLEFARESAAARAAGDFQGMRDLWVQRTAGRFDEVRAEIGAAIDAQYREVALALEGGSGFVIHGNVDRPQSLRASLPEGFEYVHGRVVEIEGIRFGFAGGGASTPLQAEGEVSDDEMRLLLEQIGPVDVLCTHIPAAVRSLRTDVITGRAERGSEPILDYLLRERPRAHIFGDVHQPQATQWRLGSTLCRNVGYFRATGRPLSIDPARIG